jgi:predicted amidophosphoribosyltransferase
MKLIHRFWACLDYFLDGISARLCFGCKSAYSSERRKFYCDECYSKLVLDYNSSIKNLAFTMQEVSDYFSEEVFHYPRIYFITEYNDLTKSLMREFKYRKPHYKWIWAELLQDYLKQYSDSILTGISPSALYTYPRNTYQEMELRLIVSSVPMHSSAEKKRGFDQAKLLAKQLAKQICYLESCLYQSKTGLKTISKISCEFIPDLIIRNKNTPKLFDKNKSERLLLLDSVFECNNSYELDENSLLIIVDDITTTGASFLSIYKTLINSKKIRSDLLFLAFCGKNS